MWHITLSTELAKYICKDKQGEAVQFIITLFSQLKRNWPDYDLELVMKAGFVKDLYRFALTSSEQSVSVREFAREVLGLVIIHLKSSEDMKVTLGSFGDLLCCEEIAKPLGLTSGLRHYKRINFLNDLEKMVLHHVKHKVSVNVYEFECLLKVLLKQINNQFELFADLLRSSLTLGYRSPSFDPLINKMIGAHNELSLKILKDFCDVLENYLQTSKSTYCPSFYKQPNYVSEVAYILEQIKAHKFPDVPTILVSLHKVKVLGRDDNWTAVLESLDPYQCFPSHFTYLSENEQNTQQISV